MHLSEPQPSNCATGQVDSRLTCEDFFYPLTRKLKEQEFLTGYGFLKWKHVQKALEIHGT